MKPLCGVCGTRHESYQAHVFGKALAINVNRNKEQKKPEKAINAAINTVSNKAINKTANRREKKTYNAYMRIYMMVMRAVRSGRAEWWPRRGHQA